MPIVLANINCVKSESKGWIRPCQISLNDRLECAQKNKDGKWEIIYREVDQMRKYVSCYMCWFNASGLSIAYSECDPVIFNKDETFAKNLSVYDIQRKMEQNPDLSVLNEKLEYVHPQLESNFHVGEHKLWDQVYEIGMSELKNKEPCLLLLVGQSGHSNNLDVVNEDETGFYLLCV